MQLLTAVVLLVSFVNLGLLALTVFGKSPTAEGPDELASRLRWPTRISVSAAIAGQFLYLTMGAAWALRWTRFYPGAPLPTYTIFAGLALSLVAFLAALFGHGLKRWATIFVAIALTGLWLLAAVASVAV